MNQNFLQTYFQEYIDKSFNEEIFSVIEKFKDIAETCKKNQGKLIFAGNGASASLAEHGAVDFTKQAEIRAITFHDPNLITCFANDFGYENWMAQAIEYYSDKNDVAILISCSGVSPSVVNAADKAKELGLKVVSFTGRNIDNPLKLKSDLAFWIDSDAYNIIENTHGIWLTATIDLILKKAVYETRKYGL